MQAWAAKVAEADGFILVTPEYNYGYSAVLKNALDTLYYEWNDKPVGIVGYGAISGGLRAVMQLRQVVVELGLVQANAGVIVPFAGRAFGEDGTPSDEVTQRTANAMLNEVAGWLPTAAGQARGEGRSQARSRSARNQQAGRRRLARKGATHSAQPPMALTSAQRIDVVGRRVHACVRRWRDDRTPHVQTEHRRPRCT